MSTFTFLWKVDFMLSLNLMFRIRSNMPSSKGISLLISLLISLILGGEFFDLNTYLYLNPYVSIITLNGET